MPNIYKIGSENHIFLEANISSPGPASSIASVLDITGTGPDTPVAHSNNATGDISRQDISTKVKLNGKRLVVFTKVALIGPDSPTRAREALDLSGKYTLEGGPGGLQAFTETGDYIDPNAFLTFIVDLE